MCRCIPGTWYSTAEVCTAVGTAELLPHLSPAYCNLPRQHDFRDRKLQHGNHDVERKAASSILVRPHIDFPGVEPPLIEGHTTLTQVQQ